MSHNHSLMAVLLVWQAGFNVAPADSFCPILRYLPFDGVWLFAVLKFPYELAQTSFFVCYVLSSYQIYAGCTLFWSRSMLGRHTFFLHLPMWPLPQSLRYSFHIPLTMGKHLDLCRCSNKPAQSIILFPLFLTNKKIWDLYWHKIVI